MIDDIMDKVNNPNLNLSDKEKGMLKQQSDEEFEKLDWLDRCKELIKKKHSNWLGISNQEAISNLLDEYEQYRNMYMDRLVHSVTDSMKESSKHKMELEYLNEGWKNDLKENYTKNEILENLLKQKVKELSEPNLDRFESDEEKQTRLKIEIKLLKDILNMNTIK